MKMKIELLSEKLKLINNNNFDEYLYDTCAKIYKNSRICLKINEEDNFDEETNDEILKGLFDILVYSQIQF